VEDATEESRVNKTRIDKTPRETSDTSSVVEDGSTTTPHGIKVVDTA